MEYGLEWDGGTGAVGAVNDKEAVSLGLVTYIMGP